MTPEREFWCAVQVKRNCFRKAEQALAQQQIAVFCPKQRGEMRRFGKQVAQASLLFPGYFFVAIDEANPQWRAVANTVGVSRIVMKNPGVPARMPAPLLDGLMRRCDAGGFLLPPSEIQAGDNVRISSGPFSQFIATVERVEPERRVWVLLDLLGSERPVEVRLDDLAARCG